MAETKKAKASKSKPKKRSGPGSRSRRDATSKAKASKSINGSPAAAKKGRKAPSSSADGAGADQSVKNTVVNGSHAAANGIVKGAQHAKVPLIATGVALVGGAAATIAVRSVGGKRKVFGVSVPKGKSVKGNIQKAAGAVSEAARQADQIGRRISRVAGSVESVSETANKAAKKT